MGWLLSRGRADLRSAKNRNTWLPVSAQECAASAAIEAEPERTAATDFAAATSTFATKAMMTVSRVELDLVRFSDSAMRLPYPALAAAARCRLPNSWRWRPSQCRSLLVGWFHLDEGVRHARSVLFNRSAVHVAAAGAAGCAGVLFRGQRRQESTGPRRIVPGGPFTGCSGPSARTAAGQAGAGQAGHLRCRR